MVQSRKPQDVFGSYKTLLVFHFLLHLKTKLLQGYFQFSILEQYRGHMGKVWIELLLLSLSFSTDEIDKFVPGQNPKPTLIDSDTQSNSLSPLSHCIAGKLRARIGKEKKVHHQKQERVPLYVRVAPRT